MEEFKAKFTVASKGFKQNEKGSGADKEIEKKFHTYLTNEEGLRINLHSPGMLPLGIDDELELRAVKFQKKLKE
jgi:hypothetical protein